MKMDLTPLARMALMLQNDLDKNQVSNAARRAINKTITGIRARMTTHLTKTVNTKAGVVKSAMPIQKATTGNLTAKINVDGTSIPLINFLTPASRRDLETRARNSKGEYKPGRLRIFKGGPVSLLHHAFIVPTSKSSYLAERVNRGKGSGRGPIKGLYGVSIASQAEKAYHLLQGEFEALYDKRMEEELNWEIIKLRRKLGLE